MKSVYLFLFLFFSSLTMWSQTTGAITGSIKTPDGSPAEFANVSMEGTTVATVTNAEGKFTISNVTPGNYTLITSFIGMENHRQSIEVKPGETTRIDYILKENNHALNEVVVSGSRLTMESPYVSKMPLKNSENPQVYNSVSSAILKQQAITNYDDALKNVPGIQRLWESTGRGGDGASYFSLRGFESQATMVNGLPGLTNGNLDPANVERIEVIKGPSGTLFGSSLIAYGGFINTVTKKPYADFGGEITYMGGSFGLNRVTADLNAPLDKVKEVIVRMNTAYQTENSFQDAGFRKSFFIAPALSYKVNDRLLLLINTEFMQEEKTTPPMLFLGRDSPLQYKNLADLNYNRKRSFYSNDLAMKNPRYNLQGQVNYKLSGQWTSQTVFSRGVTQSSGYYSYIYDNENEMREFGMYMTKDQSQTITSDIQQNFIGDFKLGSMRNRLVAGLDLFQRNSINGGAGYAWVHNINAQGDINYIDPATGEEAAPRSLTQSSIDQLLSATGSSSNNSKDASYSAYASNVLNLTPALLVMTSLRVDYLDNKADLSTSKDDFNQTVLSPRFGILYQPVIDKLSVFANYMNGFHNLAPQQVADADGSNARSVAFKPEHANQLEFGIKSSLFADKLNATISYYNIQVADVVTADPTNRFNSIQGGEVQSKGLEIDLNVNPIRELNLILGYAHNDSKVIKGDEANVWLETGKRPFWSGPADMVNAWATYTISAGTLKGWGIGAGGNYAGEFAILDSNVTGKFVLPSYTVINTSLYYNHNRFRIALNINNVTDKEYYNGGWSTITPQKPRNAVVSLSCKF